MKEFLEKVKKIVTSELNPENISLIDNSNLHVKHKSFDPKRFHLKLIIESKKLRKMNKIDAHKLIFSIKVIILLLKS